MTKVHVGLACPIDLRQVNGFAQWGAGLGPGYSFTMTAHLANELLQRGHCVSVFALDPQASESHERRWGNLAVYVQPMRPSARARGIDFFAQERQLLARAMSHARTDVIHAHWTYEFALAAQRSRLPTVITVHDWAPAVLRHHRDSYRAIRLLMQGACLTRAQSLTAVSPYIAHRVAHLYRKRPALIPNGVPIEPLPPRRAMNSSSLVIGSLNVNDDPLKNVRTLVRAFAQFRLQEPKAQLKLAGPGFAPGSDIQLWAATEHLDTNVEFVGAVPATEVASYLAGLDVFVHPSLEESFGLVLAEAMAVGTPVIGGRNSGAVSWVLDDGRAGVLSDVANPSGIASALTALVSNESRRMELSSAGRRRVETEFGLAAMVDRYEAVYGEAVDRAER